MRVLVVHAGLLLTVLAAGQASAADKDTYAETTSEDSYFFETLEISSGRGRVPYTATLSVDSGPAANMFLLDEATYRKYSTGDWPECAPGPCAWSVGGGPFSAKGAVGVQQHTIAVEFSKQGNYYLVVDNWDMATNQPRYEQTAFTLTTEVGATKGAPLGWAVPALAVGMALLAGMLARKDG